MYNYYDDRMEDLYEGEQCFFAMDEVDLCEDMDWADEELRDVFILSCD